MFGKEMDLKGFNQEWRGFSDVDIRKTKSETTSSLGEHHIDTNDVPSQQTTEPSEEEEEGPVTMETGHGPNKDILNDESAQCNLKESVMARHKLQLEMEEENKKKKKLIEQTLQERYSQSQQESECLKKVHADLVTLDKLVPQDVKVLRRKIEEASRNQNEARFEAAEKEYVLSKIHLHKIKEHKALLSEHLFAVIHETETRKAKKLAELCQKLSIGEAAH